MNQTYTKMNSYATSKKIRNYTLAFVNETLDTPQSSVTLRHILPDCRFEPKKSTLDAILAYSRKK